MIKKAPRLRPVSTLGLVPALLLAGLLSAVPASGQAWDSFPQLRAGSQSAVHPSLDAKTFRGLEACLQGIEARSGARYFAAAVGVSDPSGRPDPNAMAAIEYAPALADAWAGRMSGSDVLIVFALRNRAVAVYGGDRWRGLGFEGEMVDLTIETSSYADLARGGRFADAICQLARDVEQTLISLAPPAANAPAQGSRRAGDPDAKAAPNAPAAGSAGGSRSSSSSSSGCSLPFLFLLFGAVAFFLFTRRRSATKSKKAAAEEIARWQTRLSAVADKLLQLESEHPLYFTATERWSGESLEADRRCAKAVNRVYLLYSTAHELQGRAQALLATGGAWRSAPYDQAWRLLREEKIDASGRDVQRLATGEDGDVAFTGPSSGLLDEVDAAYAEALESLAEVSEIEATFYAASERLEKAASAATAACSERSELELPTGHLLAQLNPVLEQRRQVQLELMNDPLRAAALYEEMATQLEELARLATAGNRIAADLRGATAEKLAQLSKRVDELRGQGMRLQEPGFDPDLQLDRGDRQTREIEQALVAGQEEAAITEHARLGRGLEELTQMIEASVAGRESLPGELSDLELALRALGERRPGAERLLEDLQARYAEEAFDPAGDNLQELTPIESEIAQGFEQIRRDHKDERYLAALEDLSTCRRLLESGRALLDELESVAEHLEKLREQARAGLEELVRRRPSLAKTLETQGVPTSIRHEGELALRGLTSLEKAAKEERPNWPVLSSDVEETLAEWTRLERQAQAEIQAYGQASPRSQGLETQLRELAGKVRAESRDRAHVAQAVSDAESLLAEWQKELVADELGGVELLERAGEVARRLEWASGIWRSELDVIHRATAELRAAQVKLDREGRHHYGHGVRAHLSPAQRWLDDAERAARERDWDQVVNIAHRAGEEIDREVRRARQEAQEREDAERRRLDAIERRRRARLAASVTQAALQAAAAAAATAAGSRGGRRHGAWPSAGTSRSGFGRRRGGGGGWGGSRSGGRGGRGGAGGGGW